MLHAKTQRVSGINSSKTLHNFFKQKDLYNLPLGNFEILSLRNSTGLYSFKRFNPLSVPTPRINFFFFRSLFLCSKFFKLYTGSLPYYLDYQICLHVFENFSAVLFYNLPNQTAEGMPLLRLRLF